MNAAFAVLTTALLAGHPGAGCSTCAAPACDSCGHVSFFDRFRGMFSHGSCNTCAPACTTCAPVCAPAPVCNTCNTCSSCGHWGSRTGLFSGLFNRHGHNSCGCDSCAAPSCCGDGMAAPAVSMPGAPVGPEGVKAPPQKMPGATPTAPPPAKTPAPAPAPAKGVNLQIESSPAPLAVPSYAPTIENAPQQPAGIIPNSLRSPF